MTKAAESFVQRISGTGHTDKGRLNIDGFPVDFFATDNCEAKSFDFYWLKANQGQVPSRLRGYLYDQTPHVIRLVIPKGVIAEDEDITYNGK